MNTPKYNYYYDEYFNDMATLYDRYVNRVNPHVVGVYRGSLPIATHLSNVLECPMSIIKFQSYDGNDKKAEWLLNLTEDKSLRDKPQFFPYLIVIDDIYDTGNTFRAIKKLPEFQNNPDYSLTALFGNANKDNVFYQHEQLYRWIVFPWERVKGGM